MNKSITGIQYNVLDLPSVVTFSDGSTVTNTSDYFQNVIYENVTTKLVLTEDGDIGLSDNEYHYYLKDHQGNTRMTIYQDDVVQKW